MLNSQDLKIDDNIILELSDGSIIKAAELDTSDNDCETIALIFATELPIGKCKVTLNFSGELNDSLKGLYRSKYTRYCYLQI